MMKTANIEYQIQYILLFLKEKGYVTLKYLNTKKGPLVISLNWTECVLKNPVSIFLALTILMVLAEDARGLAEFWV